MLLSKESELKWTNRIKTYYTNKGYPFTKINDIFNVKVEDLTKGSHALVNVKCDCQNCKNPYLNIIWKDYIRDVKEDGKYYCQKCAIKLFGGENSRKTKLINSISFAQWGIDNLGKDFLEKYWDWEKNTVDPWEISYGYTVNKVWIKCQEKDYHESYDISCSHFVNGKRCSYCGNKKVHPLDSVGKLLEDNGLLHLWSDKNKKSPYEYSYGSGQSVYWKCPEGLHTDYKRDIHCSTARNFRCPECQYSKGEERISKYLINKGFMKISQEDFEQLVDKDKYNKDYFIPQMKFDGLVGIKGGLLSYDFYLPKYINCIEYQGEFHDNDGGNGTKYMKSKFPKQLEHDRRKREYAQNNNIKLLEIWYYDFDKIEEILDSYLINLTNQKEALV